jgi:hypothetical protein
MDGDQVTPIPKLSAHGAEIPAIGFGTLQLGDCAEIVALKRPDGRIANPKGRAPAWD